MNGDDCNCDQCNNDDDAYANEHPEECCCEECHDCYHYACEIFFMDICETCRAIVEEEETLNGNGKWQEN